VKYHGETLSNKEYTPKNEGQECKTGPVQRWVLVREKMVSGDNE
jgi:hypothetical protein